MAVQLDEYRYRLHHVFFFCVFFVHSWQVQIYTRHCEDGGECTQRRSGDTRAETMASRDDLGVPASERRRTSLRALQRLNHHVTFPKSYFASPNEALCAWKILSTFYKHYLDIKSRKVTRGAQLRCLLWAQVAKKKSSLIAGAVLLSVPDSLESGCTQTTQLMWDEVHLLLTRSLDLDRSSAGGCTWPTVILSCLLALSRFSSSGSVWRVWWFWDWNSDTHPHPPPPCIADKLPCGWGVVVLTTKYGGGGEDVTVCWGLTGSQMSSGWG